MAEGPKNREPKKLERFDDEAPWGVEDRASCRSTAGAMRSASEGHDAFAREDRSFAPVAMPRAST